MNEPAGPLVPPLRELGEDLLHTTPSFRGLGARIVAADHLYHLEHHLYPAVPHQHWPLLAERLDPYLARAGVRPSRLWL